MLICLLAGQLRTDSGFTQFFQTRFLHHIRRFSDFMGRVKRCGTVIAFFTLRQHDFDVDCGMDAEIGSYFAVGSTKGKSAGSVAGSGLMARTGRAPMLSADYSFWKRLPLLG